MSNNNVKTNIQRATIDIILGQFQTAASVGLGIVIQDVSIRYYTKSDSMDIHVERLFLTVALAITTLVFMSIIQQQLRV